MSRIEPLTRSALILPDLTTSPVAPCRILLALDTRTGALRLRHLHSTEESARPAEVYYGFVLWLDVPLLADAERLTGAINAGEIDPLIERITTGAAAVWDGDHQVCHLTDDATAATEELQEWLNDVPELPEPAGLWEAGDWIVDGVGEVTAATTDEELSAIAENIAAEALSESVVLYGTLQYLEDLRGILQKAKG